MQNVLLNVLVLSAVSLPGCHGDNTTLLSPAKVEAWENSEITLTCSFNGQHNTGVFYWYLNTTANTWSAFITNCTINIDWLKANILTHACIKNNFSITLRNISQHRNEDTWGCAYSYDDSSIKYTSNTVKIVVQVPVKNTTITPRVNQLQLAENNSFTFTCTSSNSQPRPIFYWYLTNENKTEGITEIFTENNATADSTDPIPTYHSILKITFNRTWNGWVVFCCAKNRDKVSSDKIRMNVTYPPEGPPNIEQFIHGSEINIILNEFANLQCSITGGNPLPWLVWNKESDFQLTVSGNVVSRKIHWQAVNITKDELICMSVQSETKLTTSVTVNVLYPPDKPEIKVQTSSGGYIPVNNTLSVIEGQPFTLNCSAKSNPPISLFEWNYSSRTTGFILNITSASRHHAKTIKCNVSNVMQTNFSETPMTGRNTTHFDLNVLYPPTINTLDVKTLKQGEDLNYSCNFDPGNPSATNITWSWMNQTWNGPILQLNNVSKNQEGVYTCSVNNIMTSWDETQVLGTVSGHFHLLIENNSNPDSTNNDPSTPLSNASTVITGAAAGTAGGVVMIVILLIIVILYKRRLNNKKQGNSGQYIGLNSVNDKTMELNQDVQQIDKNDREKSPVLPVRQKIGNDVHCLQALDDYDDKIQTDCGIYGNDYSRIKRIERIEVVELFPYLVDKTADFFATDFAKLPQGLTKPYEFSQKPENIALNRYHGIYPYDHSRVKIAGYPEYFINACYIDGYKRKKAYIASLGPLSKTSNRFVMFWQMVWSEKSDVIVMLTKLTEPSGVKCDQYWPNDETSEAYGEVTVTSTGEETYSDYIMRKFSIMKSGQKRNLKHFHFMAWPDKSIPADVTCLLEFRRSVRASHSSGPLIVHCSAGIGRTGTLIAIDMLIEEGQKKGSVNVLECVKTMRDQRTNMVQTLDQYYYIYKALLNALVFDNEAIPAEKFHKYVETSKLNQFSDMFKTFNLSAESDTTIENNSRNLNKALKEKNRVGSDIPGDANRVRLFLNRGMESSDYINAMYLNSFTVADHFIAAQSPLPNGVEDFLCLIYQENCCCVVSMDGEQARQSTGSYVPPDNSSFTAGNYNVQCSRLDTKETYVVRKLKIEINGQIKGAEKVVYHFQFLGWLDGNKVPNDPRQFVEFTEDVERFADQFGAEGSHVLVHCLNAFERSCLFCAVVTMIEKIKHEKEVCIPNTLRQIRTRRKLAIPTLEQFKFCYQAADAFVSKEKAGTSNAENSYMNVTMT